MKERNKDGTKEIIQVRNIEKSNKRWQEGRKEGKRGRKDRSK